MKALRITQIAGLTSGTTGKPILAALDDQGRVWVADPSTPSVPCWQRVEPIPAEEPADPPSLSAFLKHVDTLLRELATDLERLNTADMREVGEAVTAIDRATVAIHQAGRSLREARHDR